MHSALLGLLLSLTTNAQGGDQLCKVTDAEDITEMLAEMESAVAQVRMDAAAKQIQELHARLPCLENPAMPSHLTRYGRAKALLAFMDQDEEEARAWMWMAHYATPDWPWPEGMDEEHPLRMLLANRLEPSLDGPPGTGLTVVKKGAIRRNGSPLGVPAVPESVPGLTQLADAKGVVTDAYWQDGGRFREDLIGVAGPPLATPGWFVAEDTDAAIAALAKRDASDSANATAEVSCEPLSADGFRAIVDRAHAAIDADDLLGHTRHYTTLRKNFPCLDAPVPSEAWATFLVGLAIVERATGHEWEQPLYTAVTTDPEVARDKAPKAIRDFVAEPAPPGDLALPEDARFYVDGRAITAVPELPGLHLVQREREGQWETRMIRSGPFPEDWRTSDRQTRAPRGPHTPSTVIAIAGIGGFGSILQSLDNPGFIPSVNDSGPVTGITHWGTVPTGPVSMGWDLTVPLQVGSSLGADLYAGAELGGVWRAFLGAGATSAALTQGDTTSMVLLPTPHLGVVGLVPAGALDLDIALGGGWTPAATHLRGRTALLGGGGTSWLVGLEGTWTVAGFADALGRTVVTGRWHAGLAAGIVLR